MAQARPMLLMHSRQHRVPLWLKVAQTLFVAVVVPVYWRQYGPANFLWFSDIGLLATVPALWWENRLLASMQAVAVGLLEGIWIVDFVGRLLTGVNVIGMASYMWDETIPLPVRGLSLFHLWMPFLYWWMVYRLGYDRRALAVQTLWAWLVLLVCYFLTDRADNINWTFGPGEKPQRAISSWLYLAALMVFFPVCVYLPSHLLMKWLFRPQRDERRGD